MGYLIGFIFACFLDYRFGTSLYVSFPHFCLTFGLNFGSFGSHMLAFCACGTEFITLRACPPTRICVPCFLDSRLATPALPWHRAKGPNKGPKGPKGAFGALGGGGPMGPLGGYSEAIPNGKPFQMEEGHYESKPLRNESRSKWFIE